jgi:hypothetical protein
MILGWLRLRLDLFGWLEQDRVGLEQRHFLGVRGKDALTEPAMGIGPDFSQTSCAPGRSGRRPMRRPDSESELTPRTRRRWQLEPGRAATPDRADLPAARIRF